MPGRGTYIARVSSFPQIQVVFFIAFVVYCIAAIKGEGWFNADEYYQIIGFAIYKLTVTGINDLPWEYHEQLRSGILPLFFYTLTKICYFFTIENPFTISCISRLLTALYSLSVLYLWAKKYADCAEAKTQGLCYAACISLSWFLPFLLSRFSAECWSANALLLGVYFLEKNSGKKWKQLFVCGLVFGLAFQLRYQCALVIAGVLLHCIFIKKYTLKEVVYILYGGLFIIIIALFIDRWLYDEFCFPAWNYFDRAFIHPRFGNFLSQVPITFYFNAFFFSSFPIIALVIVLSLLSGLKKVVQDARSWGIALFLLVHISIPHKEFRFLFPILPLLLILCYEQLCQWIPRYPLIKYFVLVYIFLNISFALIASTKAAGYGRGAAMHYLYDAAQKETIKVVYTSGANPWRPFEGSPDYFYYPDKIEEQKISSFRALDTIEGRMQKTYLVSFYSRIMQPDSLAEIAKNGYILCKTSVPDLHRILNRYWFDNASVMYIFEKK